MYKSHLQYSSYRELKYINFLQQRAGALNFEPLNSEIMFFIQHAFRLRLYYCNVMLYSLEYDAKIHCLF